ncbi:MAG: DUF559 domain-containing protein [bacterium]|nr:DUF559 domain-containing protein [bacterium]
MNRIPYNPKLKARAAYLRKNSTLSEVILWKYLKKKQRLGLDFNRQKPIGNFIVDFFNVEYKLGIEVDGSSHENKHVYDTKRHEELVNLGIRILYIDDRNVKNRLPMVIDHIDNWISKTINI